MSQSDCNRNCWISAAIAGVIVLLFKSGVGDMHWLSGALIGFITFLLLGGFLQWLLCEGQQAPFDSGLPIPQASVAPPAQRGDATLAAATPIIAGATPAAVAALNPIQSPAHTPPGPKEQPAKKPAAKEKPAAAPAKAAATSPADQPDDLKLIKGVGPKVEAWLNENGIWRFEQIAAWTPADIADFMERMGRMGARIESDAWTEQARAFVAEAAQGKVY